LAKVKKLNRVLTVNDNAVNSYLKEGYDQIDEKGKIIKLATGGKTISVAMYNEILEEIKELKEENKKLKDEIKKLKK